MIDDNKKHKFKRGDKVKGWNGYEWIESEIGKWEYDSGRIYAGMQNETISLTECILVNVKTKRSK